MKGKNHQSEGFVKIKYWEIEKKYMVKTEYMWGKWVGYLYLEGQKLKLISVKMKGKRSLRLKLKCMHKFEQDEQPMFAENI